MNIQRLRESLQIRGDARISIGTDVLKGIFGKSMIEPLFGESQPLEIVLAESLRECGASGFSVRGKAALSALHLPDNTDVVACFEEKSGDPSGEDDLRATLRFTCPQGWRFEHSFPEMSLYPDDPESLLGSLRFEDAQFILSTYDDLDNGLKKGLNFAANWHPAGMLGMLGSALEGKQSAQGAPTFGPVVLPTTTKVPDLKDDQFPWDVDGTVPGVCLYAKLGTIDPFFAPPGGGNQDGQPKKIELGVRVYSPVSLGSMLDHPEYEPMMAFVGAMKVPGGAVEFTARRWDEADDELVLKGAFRADAEGGHQSALEHLTKGVDTKTLLPEPVRTVLSQLQVADVAFHLVARKGGGYDLAATRLNIKFHHGTETRWSPVKDLDFAIALEEMRLVVLSPLDGADLEFFATLEASVEICGAKLAVTIEAPRFSVFAEQVEGQLDSDALFKKYLPADTPQPPKFAIDHISLMVEPGVYYAFSMMIKPGESWGAHKIPDVRLSISNLGWEFEARVEGGDGVPVLGLIGEIEALKGLKVPSVIEKGLKVNGLTVAYETQSEHFSLECEGSLELAGSKDGQPTHVQATFTAESTHQSDGSPPSQQFGGQIVLDAGSDAPLEFDLSFGTDGESSILLAGFHDKRGHPVRVRDLLHAIPLLRELGDSVDGLEITLHDAVLAYERDKRGSRYLLGLDVAAGIELSAPKLPGLPLVSDWSATDEPLKLALQVTLTTEQHTSTEIKAIKALGDAGAFLPDDGVPKGVSLTAALRVGTEQRRLSVPVGPQELGAREQSGSQPRADSARSGADVTADGTQWLKIQKSFGPVHVERVGVSYREGKVWALVDAAFELAGLTISLDGLSASTPLKPWQPTFGLRGLGVDYRNGVVEIGGAFLAREFQERDDQGNPRIDDKGRPIPPYRGFAGSAVVRAKELTLSASGVFCQLKGHPSLFLYAVLDHTFGGPAFFFVTGLAAGFGYNRALLLPTVEELARFPLITQVMQGDDQGGNRRDPEQALRDLELYVPPAVGESFLAVGVRFKSFQMVDTFALLVGRFSHRFEIDLLGLSTLIAPPSPPSPAGAVKSKTPIKTPIAEAQLALKATFIPDEGTLTVRGLLTPGSYVLSRQCRLSGGFAFYSWFKDVKGGKPGDEGAKAGDFVATLGGYHPAFRPPAHYPVVPRLELQWQVNDHLTIKGSAYYALTAHALMAGGLLDAVWHDGDVRASFTAAADFLLAWQPYHYEANVAVVMRAEVTIRSFGTHHLSFDAGANVHLSGPEFSGTADIHVKVLIFDVSFNVAFGHHAALPVAFEWTDFREAFLPEDICGIGIQGGLIRSIQDPKADSKAPERWIVDPANVAFAVTSTAPIAGPGDGQGLGILPMAVEPTEDGHSGFESTLEITILHENKTDVTTEFSREPITKAVPVALWGRPKVKKVYGKTFVEPPDVNGRGLIEAAVGCVLKPAESILPGGKATHGLRPDKRDVITDAFAWMEPVPLGALEGAQPPRDQLDVQAREAMLKAVRSVSDPRIASGNH